MISISSIASLYVEDTPAHCICRCLVWEVTNIIEKRYIAAAGGVNNVRGTKRQLSQVYSDSGTTVAVETPIWDPKHWKHVERELGRYQTAAVEAFKDAIDISFSGPDGSKIGTEFSCTVAGIMNSTNKKVCVALPHASPFIV